jgi:glycosyltransferase involved in cell wall biosynthesis
VAVVVQEVRADGCQAATPLHIAHGVLSLDVGGLERIVVSLARAAVGRGHRVTVVCVERPGQLAGEAEAAGAAVVSLGKPAGRLPEFVEKAGRVLDELRPDVVHTHQIGAAWYLGRAARRLGIPVLHTEHGNHFARTRKWGEAVRTRLLYYQSVGFIDRFCCVSPEIGSAVTRWWTVPRGKVEVVPNGLPTDGRADLPPPEAVRESLGIPLNAPVVGTVGRLTEVKRQDVMIRAVGRLRQRLPDVRLLLVGDGPERSKLEALARDLGLADRVHFAGYQPCPEQFLRAMDVFCLTSRTEGFPVALLEAWLAGVPTVCTAVGGIPAVVTQGEDGLLIPPGDEDALLEALSRLFNDRTARDRLGRAGEQTVRVRYTLDRMADAYEARYRSLLAARGEGR